MAAPLPAEPSSLSLQERLRADPACYAACYCEENVLQLAQHPLAQPLLSQAQAQGRTLYACLVTSPSQRVAVLRQRAGQGAGGLVVWDYHVLLLSGALALDLDTTLPFPAPAAEYLAAAFPLLPAGAEGLAPRFRLLPLPDYAAHLASDRRHMARQGGGHAAPLPQWAPPRGAAAASAHTLPELLRVDEGCGGPGRVLAGVAQLWEALGGAAEELQRAQAAQAE